MPLPPPAIVLVKTTGDAHPPPSTTAGAGGECLSRPSPIGRFSAIAPAESHMISSIIRSMNGLGP
uniref:Uncharacterized protein n=1 Tax=Arundo donax TaxID=35708 RepID=A0A0A9HWC5_ARUDO